MTKNLAVISLVCGWAYGVVAIVAAEPETADQNAAAAAADDEKEAKQDSKPVDVTEKMREYNSDKFASPPTKFRKGHVTKRELDPKAIVKTQAGFTIKLPSGAPVPTPTVYDGKVYVSGGFHSKEYYCFDATSGKVVWAINLDDDGPSSAVCSDGICVFNTESCTIFAVNANTGSHIWSHWLGDPLTSTPAIANGLVFTSYPAAGGGGGANQQGGNFNPSLNNNAPQQLNNTQQLLPQQIEEPEQTPECDDNTDTFENEADSEEEAEVEEGGKKRPPMSHVLACLDLKTGKILWQKWIDSDVMTSPVCVDHEVYITTFAGTVMRFQQKSGKILSAKKERATSAPVVVGDDVLFSQRADKADEDGPVREALAFNDRQKGTVKFSVNPKVAKHIDNKVQENTEHNAKGQQLDAGNGFGGGAPAAANPTAAWGNIGYGSVSTMQSFQGSRGCVFGHMTLTCPGDEIICNDNGSGKVKWKVKLEGDIEKVGGFLAAPPAAAGKHVFVSTLDGHVLQLDPEKGKLVKKHKVGSPVRFQPAIVDGRIFVGTQDGKLVVLDTKDRSLTGWTTWGGNAAHTGVKK